MGIKEIRPRDAEPDHDPANVSHGSASVPGNPAKERVGYRLAREDELADPWANYDPEAAHAAMLAVAGSWSDIDTEQMITDIYRWREGGSRPPDRPNFCWFQENRKMSVKEPKIIHVEPGSDLADVVDEAEASAIILEKDGVRYRLAREDELTDPWANYDPEAIRRSLRELAGTISPEEADEWKANLYRWREEGSRPLDRR